ncbi:MAG: hypothetical protein Greene071436_308 [Parcubacteria group bacterium Greene0714_36]|nr:MAG: hypothetical protein Greene071436_308 [Parcubacteria group bacterium Greene0714_36]
MSKKITSVLFSSFFLFVLVVGASVSASSPFDIEFPIAALGGCADKAACAAYCDDAANGVSCAEFASLHGLGDKRSIEAARTIQEGGPGGCASEGACRAYCEDPARETECVEFAVSKGFMTRAEADRALKPGPGGCRGKACRQYCEDSAHEEECFEFGVANGFIPKEEAERIREFKKKFGEKREGPGGCQGEEQCRAYCNDPDHIDACLAFAEDHGFVDKEQAKIIKKTVGKGPGDCKGANECRAYCEDPAHQTECIDFGEKNGFMTKEEAERARKFSGKDGPGGCRGGQCRDFCNQQGNEDQCLAFAEREGILPKEELERARKFMTASREGGPGGCRGAQCRDYCEDTAHREECFGFAKKNDLISAEEQEQFDAGSKIEEVVRTSGGPGGCKNDDECRSYCTDPGHVEECIAFGAAHGGVPPEKVREMLKQFTERRFEARGGPGEFGGRGFDDFQKFEQDSNRRFEEFHMLEEQFRGQEFPGFGPPGQGGFPGGEFPGGPPGGFPGQGGEFPGRPSEFPGGPGGGGGPQNDGGSAGQSDDRGGRPGFGGERRDGSFGGGSFGPPPQLRGGLIRQFDQGELPEGFHQLPPEERQQFFHDKFPEFNPPRQGEFPEGGFPNGDGASERNGFSGQEGGSPSDGFQGDHGQFPGRPPESFPGSRGEFPGRPGEFPSGAPQGFPGQGSEFPGQPPAGFPQDGHMPQFPDSSSGSISRPIGSPPPSEGFHPPEGIHFTDIGKFPSPSSDWFFPSASIRDIFSTTAVRNFFFPAASVR